MGPLIAKEVELKQTIRGSLTSILDPHTSKIGTALEPAVGALAKPLYKAYRVAIKIFHAEMNKVCAHVWVCACRCVSVPAPSSCRPSRAATFRRASGTSTMRSGGTGA